MHTTETTNALILKLYFYTQFIITPPRFDLVWLSDHHHPWRWST